MSKKTKKPKPYIAPEQEKKQEPGETDDIYDSAQLETMLDEDEISASEEGFMRGRDQEPSKKETRRNAINHHDSVSVELAKQESEDS
jgi:hypothetical protein